MENDIPPEFQGVAKAIGMAMLPICPKCKSKNVFFSFDITIKKKKYECCKCKHKWTD